MVDIHAIDGKVYLYNGWFTLICHGDITLKKNNVIIANISNGTVWDVTEFKVVPVFFNEKLTCVVNI